MVVIVYRPYWYRVGCRFDPSPHYWHVWKFKSTVFFVLPRRFGPLIRIGCQKTARHQQDWLVVIIVVRFGDWMDSANRVGYQTR